MREHRTKLAVLLLGAAACAGPAIEAGWYEIPPGPPSIPDGGQGNDAGTAYVVDLMNAGKATVHLAEVAVNHRPPERIAAGTRASSACPPEAPDGGLCLTPGEHVVMTFDALGLRECEIPISLCVTEKAGGCCHEAKGLVTTPVLPSRIYDGRCYANSADGGGG
jgi:hypothetical protein